MCKNILYVILLIAYTAVHGDQVCAEHAWNTAPPDNQPSFEYEKYPIDNKNIAFVISKRTEQASKLLKEASHIKITNKKANELIGYSLQVEKSESIFLVRGLKDKVGAEIVVYYHNGKLRVVSQSIGKPDKVSEMPLVITLDSEPIKVYVYCQSMY